MAEKMVLTNSNEATSAIFGAFDANVKKIEKRGSLRIFKKDSTNINKRFKKTVINAP